MPENDIIADMMQRLSESLDPDLAPPDMLHRIESGLRQTWQGNMVYITKINRQTRNGSIMAEYRRGDATHLIATRHGLTERRIRQIINCRKK